MALSRRISGIGLIWQCCQNWGCTAPRSQVQLATRLKIVENTQPLLRWTGRGLLVRICLFYMHTRVLIMHVCVHICTHIFIYYMSTHISNIDSFSCWAPRVCPVTTPESQCSQLLAPGQTSPLQLLAQTVTHISRYLQKVLTDSSWWVSDLDSGAVTLLRQSWKGLQT